MASTAVSPHMWYWFPESGSTKWKECNGPAIPATPWAQKWSFSLVKKSRGTGNTALTSAGFGQGQNDSSMKPTTGVTSRPFCGKRQTWQGCEKEIASKQLMPWRGRNIFPIPPYWWWGRVYRPPEPHQVVDLSPPVPLSGLCPRHLRHRGLSSHRGNTLPQHWSSATDTHSSVKCWGS